MAAQRRTEIAEVVGVRLDGQGLNIRFKWQRTGAEQALNWPADSPAVTSIRVAAGHVLEDEYQYLRTVVVEAQEPPRDA